MSNGTTPTVEQVRDYLAAHGWRFGWEVGSVGAMYIYREPTDSGDQITVFVPASEESEDYPERVLDVANTLRVLENRDRDSILAEMLATKVPTTHLPRQPVT